MQRIPWRFVTAIPDYGVMETATQEVAPPKWKRSVKLLAMGALYGIAIRLLFQWRLFGNPPKSFVHLLPDPSWVMSVGFLCLVPFTMGWLSIPRATGGERLSWKAWIFRPWIAVAACDLCLTAGHIEGLICIIMSLPITLPLASLGGIVSGLNDRRSLRKHGSTTLCLAVIPLFVSAIEMQQNVPLSVRTVETQILIHAPASVVWDNVKTVRAISHAELRPSWTHRMGLPLPVAATLDHEGVGGVRDASFEGGLTFIETINEWQPLKRLGFTIAADTAHIPATTLDEHVTIGGPYFDVLYGEYWLEPREGGDTLLHLSSQERLSTDFNFYAGLWTDAVMRDLQHSILQVVKQRCEAEARLSARLKP